MPQSQGATTPPLNTRHSIQTRTMTHSRPISTQLIPMSTTSSTKQEDGLKALLRRLSDDKDAGAVTPDTVRELEQAFKPSAPQPAQSLAVLCLARIADITSGPEQGKKIAVLFNPLIGDAIDSNSSDPASFVPAVLLLAALAPLAAEGVVLLLTNPIGSPADSVPGSDDIDALTVLLEFGELPSPLQPALASLISALAGTKAGRELVRSTAMEWVTSASESNDVYGDTRVLCTVALSKLGRIQPQVGEPEEERLARDESSSEDEEKQARVLAQHVVSSKDAASLLPTLEGLSVLSTHPAVRDVLANDAAFLKALFDLSPVPQATGGSLPVTPRTSVGSFDEAALAPVDAAVCFGLATIIANLVMRKPVLSEQDQQMARLRRMAISGKTAVEAEDDDPAEKDEAVSARCTKLMAAGVVSALAGIVRADSQRVRETLGRITLGLVEDKPNRSLFIRDGGFRALSIVLRDSPTLPAAQALAKLVISTPPNLLFPPPHQVNALNALPPLYILLTHPSSSLLQQFESLMALTNLASIDGAIGARIVTAKTASQDSQFRGKGREKEETSVISKVEELLLDDNVLVRRAATELVCNLVNSEEGFKYFAGEDTGTRSTARLGVLLLLSDVDDLPTRLAAGGALAVLTESETACAALLSGGGISSERSMWERVGDLFGSRDEEGLEVVSSTPEVDAGLVHRGVYVVGNLLRYADEHGDGPGEKAKAKAAGVDRKLEGAIKALLPGGKPVDGVSMELVQTLVETLKLLR